MGLNRKFFSILFIFFALGSCSLDATQEKSLNRAIVQYEHSYNNHLQLLEASLTHPCVIASLLSNGDSTFSKYFSHYDFELKNYKVGKVVTKNNEIQVSLTFDMYHPKFLKTKKKNIVALSSNSGKHWFFADKKWIHSLKCDKIKEGSKHD